MNKKVFGLKKERSIKDIPLPEQSDHSLDLSAQEMGDSSFPPTEQLEDWDYSSRPNKRAGTKVVVGLVVFALVVFLYSLFFHSAQIEIREKRQKVVITNQEFTASLEGTEGSLEFIRGEPFSLRESLYLEGTTEENRQTKASGVLTVFNTDETDKNYIKNTRFQAPNGNIYRAFERFVIPQGSSKNPGSVDVLVVAENPGEKYNSEEGLSFVLPALREQGDPSFDLVYAEQKEALVGGYSGVVRVPREEDIQEAQAKLRTRLEQSLFSQFEETLPETHFTKENLVIPSDPIFNEVPHTEKGGIDLEARSSLQALVFDRDVFETFMATQLVDDYRGEEIEITNLSTLNLEVLSEDFNPQETETFLFTAVGEVEFAWTVDESQVSRLLAGKLKSHVENGLVVGLDNLEIAEVSVRPFWHRSLPAKAESITIEVK